MIQRDGATQQIVCDECGSEGACSDDFNDMIAEAKGDGWRIAKPEGRWVHECKDCVSHNSALAQAQRKFGLR